MTKLRRIALILDREFAVVRGMLEGIRTYASCKPTWELRVCPPRPHLIAHIRDWHPHGIIASIVSPRMAKVLINMNVPLVDTAYTLPNLKAAVVDVDHGAVAFLAAQYFLDRKFRHFGFFGSGSAVYVRIQESSFRQYLAAHDCTISSCYEEFSSELTTPRLWKNLTRKTQQWLQQLPRPAAILCCDDAPARYLADVCAHIGLNVPDDVALLGIGNDELECRFGKPALSSIAIPSQRIGYEATVILDRLMARQPAPKAPLLLPPSQVITRQSTDIMAVDDDVIRDALRYIQENGGSGIRVVDLVHHVSVGRRRLERKFREVLGRSILDEVHRSQIQSARELLSETELSITTIARMAGFSSLLRLDVLFTKHMGMSPTAYRQQLRPPQVAHQDSPKTQEARENFFHRHTPRPY